jgi:hypothetical protein
VGKVEFSSWVFLLLLSMFLLAFETSELPVSEIQNAVMGNNGNILKYYPWKDFNKFTAELCKQSSLTESLFLYF